MAWKLKRDNDGNVVLQDDVPVWVDDEGTESALDVNSLVSRVTAANSEAAKRKEKIRELESRLEPLADVEDLLLFRQEAEKARDTIKNLEEKDVRKAETVEKIKQEMRDGFADKERQLKRELELKVTEMQKQIEGKTQQIRQLMVSNQFATCDLFTGEERKSTLPPDAAEALFGKHFQIEEKNGAPQLIAMHNGEPIYSKERPGELATFHEAIRVIFDRYPYKEQVTRSTGAGSGAPGGRAGVAKKGSIAEIEEQLAKLGNENMPMRIHLETELHKLRQQGAAAK